NVALVAGREDQVLAALAGVRTGEPHVHDPPLMVVVRQADEPPGRQLDDVRSALQVERAGTVGGIGIRRENDVARGGRQDHHGLVAVDAILPLAVEDPLARYGRVPEAVIRDRPLKVSVVAGLLRSPGRGETALEWVRGVTRKRLVLGVYLVCPSARGRRPS